MFSNRLHVLSRWQIELILKKTYFQRMILAVTRKNVIWILYIHIIFSNKFQISLQAWKVIGIHESYETNINGWQQAWSVIFQKNMPPKNCNKNNNLSSYSNFLALLNGELLTVPCLKVIENTNPSQTFFSWTETKRQTMVLKNKIWKFLIVKLINNS